MNKGPRYGGIYQIITRNIMMIQFDGVQNHMHFQRVYDMQILNNKLHIFNYSQTQGNTQCGALQWWMPPARPPPPLVTIGSVHNNSDFVILLAAGSPWAIPWSNVDPNQLRHMAWEGHEKLNMRNDVDWYNVCLTRQSIEKMFSCV